jgi:hypothetical protein
MRENQEQQQQPSGERNEQFDLEAGTQIKQPGPAAQMGVYPLLVRSSSQEQRRSGYRPQEEESRVAELRRHGRDMSDGIGNGHIPHQPQPLHREQESSQQT